MNRLLTPPFFEIGPKNLLRQTEIEALAVAAGAAGAEHEVDVVLTVPNALVTRTAELDSGVLVFAQAMDADTIGATFGSTTAEALVDAGADGVMLNHESRQLDPGTLAETVSRAHEVGLLTIVCAGTIGDAVRLSLLNPTAILLEPPALIGTSGAVSRSWIPEANTAVRDTGGAVLMMHAGGVASPTIARHIMAAGADGTGSTSGVLGAHDRSDAARTFIASTRQGFDEALAAPQHVHHNEGDRT